MKFVNKLIMLCEDEFEGRMKTNKKIDPSAIGDVGTGTRTFNNEQPSPNKPIDIEKIYNTISNKILSDINSLTPKDNKTYVDVTVTDSISGSKTVRIDNVNALQAARLSVMDTRFKTNVLSSPDVGNLITKIAEKLATAFRSDEFKKQISNHSIYKTPDQQTIERFKINPLFDNTEILKFYDIKQGEIKSLNKNGETQLINIAKDMIQNDVERFSQYNPTLGDEYKKEAYDMTKTTKFDISLLKTLFMTHAGSNSRAAVPKTSMNSNASKINLDDVYNDTVSDGDDEKSLREFVLSSNNNYIANMYKQIIKDHNSDYKKVLSDNSTYKRIINLLEEYGTDVLFLVFATILSSSHYNDKSIIDAVNAIIKIIHAFGMPPLSEEAIYGRIYIAYHYNDDVINELCEHDSELYKILSKHRLIHFSKTIKYLLSSADVISDFKNKAEGSAYSKAESIIDARLKSQGKQVTDNEKLDLIAAEYRNLIDQHRIEQSKVETKSEATTNTNIIEDRYELLCDQFGYQNHYFPTSFRNSLIELLTGQNESNIDKIITKDENNENVVTKEINKILSIAVRDLANTPGTDSKSSPQSTNIFNKLLEKFKAILNITKTNNIDTTGVSNALNDFKTKSINKNDKLINKIYDKYGYTIDADEIVNALDSLSDDDIKTIDTNLDKLPNETSDDDNKPIKNNTNDENKEASNAANTIASIINKDNDAEYGYDAEFDGRNKATNNDDIEDNEENINLTTTEPDVYDKNDDNEEHIQEPAQSAILRLNDGNPIKNQYKAMINNNDVDNLDDIETNANEYIRLNNKGILDKLCKKFDLSYDELINIMQNIESLNNDQIQSLNNARDKSNLLPMIDDINKHNVTNKRNELNSNGLLNVLTNKIKLSDDEISNIANLPQNQLTRLKSLNDKGVLDKFDKLTYEELLDLLSLPPGKIITLHSINDNGTLNKLINNMHVSYETLVNKVLNVPAEQIEKLNDIRNIDELDTLVKTNNDMKETKIKDDVTKYINKLVDDDNINIDSADIESIKHWDGEFINKLNDIIQDKSLNDSNKADAIDNEIREYITNPIIEAIKKLGDDGYIYIDSSTLDDIPDEKTNVLIKLYNIINNESLSESDKTDAINEVLY